MTVRRQDHVMAGNGPNVMRASAGVSDNTGRGMILAFFLLLLIPAYFEIAGLRLSPLRIYVLLLTVPLAFMMIMGKFGQRTATDIILGIFCVWIIIGLMYHHGADQLGLAGMTIAEMYGGYLIGRAAVQSKSGYMRMISIFALTLLFLVPFSIMESLTGRLVIPEFISKFASSHYRGGSADGRMGLERVYSVFEHPILYGLYCSMGIANGLYSMKSGSLIRMIAVGLAIAMTFMALSSAPLLACLFQFGLIIWAWVTRGKWWLLLGLAAVCYVVVDLLSNRTPITLLIAYGTFEAHTGWGRIAIFNAGSAAVMNNPIMGIGLNDWPRPAWVSSSVDNYWLLIAMRYGLTGLILLGSAMIIHLFSIARADIADPVIKRLRLGYSISLVALFFTLITVAMWGATLIFVMMYVGAGAWFYTQDLSGDGKETEREPVNEDRRINRYSRFPARA